MNKHPIIWTFKPAPVECVMTNQTVFVYFQEPISLLAGRTMTLTLPVEFKLHSGAVLLEIDDDRLVRVGSPFLFSQDSPNITLSNQSYQDVNKNKGDLLLIMRYVY